MHEKLHENIENEALVSRFDYASLSSSVMNLFKVVAVCLYLDSVSSNEGYTLHLCNQAARGEPAKSETPAEWEASAHTRAHIDVHVIFARMSL